MTNKTRFVGLIIGIITSASAVAQTSVYNPYSQLGIGLPVFNPVAAASSMGGGYNAIRGNNYINFLNPASYSAFGYTHFQFGFETQSINATRLTGSRKANLGFFNQIALGIPIVKERLGMSFGFTPYTNVGYSFSETERISGADTSIDAKYTYEGKGGIDRFFVGFGGNPVKGLSIGFNTYFYLGNIDRTKTSYFPSGFGSSNIQSISNIRVADFGFDFGTQYVINFKDPTDSLLAKKQQKTKYRLTFGATYVLGKKMAARNTSVARYFAGDLADTYYDQDTIASRQKVKLVFPSSFGFGVSFGQPDFWQINADFNTSLWTQFRYANGSSEPMFGNSYQTSLGAEIKPRSKNPKNVLGNLTYRIGGRYGQSFLRPGTTFQDVAGSVGIGIPFVINEAMREGNAKYIYSSVNIGLEYGMSIPSSTAYTQERMVRLVFSFNLRSTWLNKYKFQ